MTATGNFSPSQLRRVTTAVRQLDEIERRQRVSDAERITVFADALDAVLAGSTVAKRELAYRSLRLEFALALSRSESAVERLLSQASTLTTHYVATLSALRAAEISLDHTRVIMDAGAVFVTGDEGADAARRGAYEDEALVHARQETPARLRPIAQLLAAQYAERTIEDRHSEAAQRRAVRLRDLDAGMAELNATLPAAEAYAIYDRLTRIVRETAAAERVSPGTPGASQDSGEAAAPTSEMQTPPRRSRDAIRADVLRDLLLLGTTDANPATRQGVHGKVQVIVPVESLTREDSAATLFAGLGRRSGTCGRTRVAELVGYGPLPKSAATEVVRDAPVWDSVVTARSGEVLAVDRYVPTPAMHRRIAARDLHCRAPGCRAPSYRCDVDHTVPAAAGGPTSTANLALLCRGHHTLKHHSDWEVTQLPGGDLSWRSPTGRVSIDRPPSRVRFRAVPPPPSPKPGLPEPPAPF